MKTLKLNESPRLRTRLIVIFACCFQLLGMLPGCEIAGQNDQALDEFDLDTHAHSAVCRIQKGKKPLMQEVGDISLMTLNEKIISTHPKKLPRSFSSVYSGPNGEGPRPALSALFNLGADSPIKCLEYNFPT